MTRLRTRSRKIIVGALFTAGMLISTAMGFGADDASARPCVHGGMPQTTHACYNGEIGDTYPLYP